jgi:hypothetical protein
LWEKLPTNQTNRKPLAAGQVLNAVSVKRSFSPQYGEFVIVTDAKGTEWYSFSGPVMSAFLGSGTNDPLTLPAKIQINAEQSKNNRTYLTVSRLLE